MDQSELLGALNAVSFSERYWDLCDRFPFVTSEPPVRARQEDVLKALHDLAVAVDYDKRDRSYLVERDRIDNVTWWGVFVLPRSGGVEMLLASDTGLGSNFAVLANCSRQLADPSFARVPPYPRPEINGDLSALKRIVAEFVTLLRLAKDGLRASADPLWEMG